MANVAKCPSDAIPTIWRDYRRLSDKSRAIYCHGNFDEYVRLRAAGKTLGLNKVVDIVKALVDLYHDDYADRFEDDA